jgi:alkaline phosphatase D
MKTAVSITVLILAMSAFATSAPETSDFSSDIQGWLVAEFPNSPGPFTTPLTTSAPSWVSTGGNPNGYIEAVDLTGNANFFQAPPSYLGDRSEAYGFTLQFDIRDILLSGTLYDGDPDVILVGGGLTLVADIGPAPTPDVWTHYSAQLSESGGWRIDNFGGALVTAAQFQTVLSSLTALFIRGEFIAGNERDNLDSVIFVPELSSATLLLCGALMCVRRRALRTPMNEKPARAVPACG